VLCCARTQQAVKAQNKHTISILIFIRVDVFMRVDPSAELIGVQVSNYKGCGNRERRGRILWMQRCRIGGVKELMWPKERRGENGGSQNDTACHW
jgi:hypothetical protein